MLELPADSLFVGVVSSGTGKCRYRDVLVGGSGLMVWL